MKVIAIDYDGIINNKDEKPIVENIKKINKLYDIRDNLIVVYTARNRNMYLEVYERLLEYKVRFHALVMDKMRADVYIDDKGGFL